METTLNNFNNLHPTERSVALKACGIQENSAFICVGKNFLNKYGDAKVRVISRRPMPLGTASEGFLNHERDGLVILLSLDLLDRSDLVNTSAIPDAIYVKADVLYGNGVPPCNSVQLMCCDAGKDNESQDGAAWSTGSGSPQLVKKTLQLGKPVPTTVPEFLALENIVRSTLQGISHVIASTTPSVLCASWIEEGLKIVEQREEKKYDSGNVNRLKRVLGQPKFDYTSSMSLAFIQSVTKGPEPPQGFRAVAKMLNAEAHAGACGAFKVEVSSSWAGVPTIMYFVGDAFGLKLAHEALTFAPSILLHPIGTEKSDADARSGATTSSPNAVLLLPLQSGALGTTKEGAVAGYMVVYLDQQQQKIAASMCADCPGNRDAGRLVEMLVSMCEWKLKVTESADDLINDVILEPIKRSMMQAKTAAQSFSKLQAGTQTWLLSEMKNELLLSIDPGTNETQGYLGDAVLDFIFALDGLKNWNGGNVCEKTTNKNLGNHLPETLRNYFSKKWNISAIKRRADVVEALFGALAMALWVSPRTATLRSARGTSDPPEAPPFSVLLEVCQALMSVLNLSTS
ncbi:hypothetical protein ERJ75_001594100 [Trypanosoma vivax]|nr:hypothetical protein TRVL_01442 [Trypanosoma vivax]KAH8605721.1 hypothetical protein ERJ75_001594100 [Trypanosoma vivax]